MVFSNYKEDSASLKEREEAAAALKKTAEDGGNTDDLLWQVLILFQNYPFRTFRGLPFTYVVKRGRNGAYVGEVLISRKERSKSLTRSTINRAFTAAIELQKEHGFVAGPKKLGTFGASYLYPMFVEFGVITAPKDLS